MASLVTIAIANTSVGLNLDNLLIMMIMTSFLPLGILLLFFHYESISHPRPRLKLLIFLLVIYILLVSFKFIIPLYLSLNGMSLDIYYSDLRLYNDDFISITLRMINLLQSSIIFIVFLQASITVIKELKTIKLRAIIIELIGLMFLIFYGFFYLIRDLFFYETYYELLTSAALIFSLIGLLLIIYNFIVHPDYLYLLPFPIFSFLIFNEGGIPCYIRKVEKLENDEPDRDLEHLMAGAFTAVSNMFREVLGAGANIRYIDADNFIILVTPLPEEKGVLIVISRGETALFKNSLIRFARTWSPKMLDEINGFFDLNEIRPKIDELIKSSFPYIAFS